MAMTNEEKYLKEIVSELKQLNRNITKMTGIHTAGYRLYKNLHLREKNCFTCRFYDGRFCHYGMQMEIVNDPETPCIKWDKREDAPEEDDQNE